jgi:hypothetical protein
VNAQLKCDYIHIPSKYRSTIEKDHEKSSTRQSRLDSVVATSSPANEPNDLVNIRNDTGENDEFDNQAMMIRPKSVKFSASMLKGVNYIIKPMSAKTPLRANLNLVKNRPSTVPRINSESNLNSRNNVEVGFQFFIDKIRIIIKFLKNLSRGSERIAQTRKIS